MSSEPPTLPKKSEFIYGSVSCITVDLHFMLPSGLYMSIKSILSATLAEVKEKLFEEASNNPINRILKHRNFYLFIAIGKNGVRQECGDESKMLSELELYKFFFKVQERIGNVEDKIMDGTIGLLIGKHLSEFNIMGGEVQECRRHLVNTVEKVLRQRGSDSHLLARYYYPPKISSGEILPDHLMDTLTDDGKFSAVFYLSKDGKQSSTEMRIQVPARASVNQVVFNVLNPTLPVQQEHEMDHVLKIVGQSSYFLDGHVEIIRYKHIRNALMKGGDVLRFKVIPLSVLYESLAKTKFVKPVYADTLLPAEKSSVSLWSLNPDILYQLTIKWVSSTNLPENYKLQIHACLYHGDRIISEIVNSPEYRFDCSTFEFLLEFPVAVVSLPRATKLCFNLMATSEAARGFTMKRFKKPIFLALAWANMMVMDYHGFLICGHHTLHMRRYDEEPEECFNFIGTTDSHVLGTTMQKVVLEIEIPLFDRLKVKYPELSEIKKYALRVNAELKKGPVELARMYTRETIDRLKQIIHIDRLVELDDKDLQFLWDHRLVCPTCEESLPKLLTACDWSSMDSVAEVRVILDRWPEIPINTALELLDYSFADPSVREFAVKNLSQKLTDDYFSEYLLQLVQVLKYEPYLNCSLAVMLLEKSLWNAHIGHFLFWHLRAEMHLPELSVRYGILLESYCRGAGGYITQLDLQLRALKKMKSMTEALQTQSGYTQEKLREKLQEYSDGEIFTMASPLNPNFLLNGVLHDKCKFMDSKMKPLWMVFRNQEELGSSVYQIFKNGDDLRQDMLTIQLFRIMDSLWQDQGLDLRLSPYGCLSTGNQIGMIEIVLNAFTLAKIHKKYGGGAKGAFSNQALYNYLVDANKVSKQIDNAIKNFTLSCAGYCVATFVLGIGDRHSDNIMLKENGQLFHIDFGHFLGNFKSKFGIKRERVPFVLTRDFLFIISRGREHTDPAAIPHMTAFRNLCERGYLILRQKASLFINLLSMMLSTGIPELRSLEDISYMREALCLDRSEAAAREFFRSKFADAINNSITVSINWYLHGIARKS